MNCVRSPQFSFVSSAFIFLNPLSSLQLQRAIFPGKEANLHRWKRGLSFDGSRGFFFLISSRNCFSLLPRFFFASIFLNPLSTALLGKKGPSLGTCQRPYLRVRFASLYSFSRANDFLLLTKFPKLRRAFLPEDTCSFSAKRPTLCLMFFSRNRASLIALLLARRLNRSYGAKTAKTLKNGKSDNAF